MVRWTASACGSRQRWLSELVRAAAGSAAQAGPWRGGVVTGGDARLGEPGDRRATASPSLACRHEQLVLAVPSVRYPRGKRKPDHGEIRYDRGIHRKAGGT